MELELRKEYGKFEDYILEKPNRFINSIEVDEAKEKKLPLPTTDCVFKWMFAREYTKRNACILLGTILKIDVEKLEEDMVLIRNEMGADHQDGKGIRMDFVGKAEDVIFNIEMNQSNTLERNIDYAGKLYSSECKKGRWKYTKVFQMNINNFRIEGQEKAVVINVLKGYRGMRSKIIVVDVYLPIIYTQYKEEKKLKGNERTILWMFIGNEEEMKKIGGNDKDMKNYLNELKKYAQDEEAMREYYEECDSAVAGREKGREEGRIEGREENQIETATTMLKKGLEPKLVQECTKLPFEKIMNIMALL